MDIGFSQQIDITGAPVRGKADAPVTLVVFSPMPLVRRQWSGAGPAAGRQPGQGAGGVQAPAPARCPRPSRRPWPPCASGEQVLGDARRVRGARWTPTAITETATRVGLDMTRFQADLNTARRPACSSPRTGPTPGRRGQRHPVDLRQRPAGAGGRRRPCSMVNEALAADLTRCPQRPGRARTRVRRQPRRPAAVRRPQPQPADRGAGHRRGHQRRPRQRPADQRPGARGGTGRGHARADVRPDPQGYPVFAEHRLRCEILESLAQGAAREIFLDKVCITARKRVISPKSINQKLYIEAIRENDIVFGIGPAGTGKTYLAVAMAVSALARSRWRASSSPGRRWSPGEKLGFLPGDMARRWTPTCGRSPTPSTT